MKKIIFVTSNNGKKDSAQRCFDSEKIELSCFDYRIVEPEINDIDLIAKSKVLQAYSYVNEPCISLDSGFYIPNYPFKENYPGAFPKREIIEKRGVVGLLDDMEDINQRECYFKDCLAYYDGNEMVTFYGITPGVLSRQIVKSNSEKIWSDLWCVFIPNGYNKTLAELTDEERKNIPGKIDAMYEFSKWYKSIVSLKKD